METLRWRETFAIRAGKLDPLPPKTFTAIKASSAAPDLTIRILKKVSGQSSFKVIGTPGWKGQTGKKRREIRWINRARLEDTKRFCLPLFRTISRNKSAMQRVLAHSQRVVALSGRLIGVEEAIW